MEASIVDLRYKMKGVLQSLQRNEEVKIYYHSDWIGTIIPKHTKRSAKKVAEHPFFGMYSEKNESKRESVEETMETLRGARYK